MKFVNSNIKNNNTLFFKRRSREVINSSLKLYDKFSFSFIHLNFYLLNLYNNKKFWEGLVEDNLNCYDLYILNIYIYKENVKEPKRE